MRQAHRSLHAPGLAGGTGFSLEFDCIPPALYLWTTTAAYEADLQRLITDPVFRQWRGDFSRSAVRLHYSDAAFLYSMEAIYGQADRLAPIEPDAHALDWRCDRVDVLLAQLTENMARDRQQANGPAQTSGPGLNEWLAHRQPNAAQRQLLKARVAAGVPPGSQVAIAVLSMEAMRPRPLRSSRCVAWQTKPTNR